MNASDEYDFLEDKIFNKEKQIKYAEDKYINIQNKSEITSKLFGMLFFIPSFIIASTIHYNLFLNLGLPSLFLTPSSILVVICLTGVGVKINRGIYSKKISRAKETINKLNEEHDRYKRQLEKIRGNNEKKDNETLISSEIDSAMVYNRGEDKVLTKSIIKRH